MALREITLRGTHGNNEKLAPSKLICIGRNYVDHIHELGNELPDDMVVFLKPNSAISHHLIAFSQEAIHYEAELCFLVKDGTFAAVGLGLDLTKRELQGKLKSKGLPWERAKAFDGSAVFSEFVCLDAQQSLMTLPWSFEFELEGQLLQRGDSALMLYSPQQILQSISEFMTLEDGDIVMTGTPKGVGVLQAGGLYQARLWQGPLDGEKINSQTPTLSVSWQAS
ncbi:fumarylacetoacetate (FAA) hydrolase [Shewanella denitrificans OS217]|uniref:Fumarylacetoacetate (FAA) hydrolase n=1 Tax=Shewanella denitrificans (strain OS217 / ATCC BAA-1090 / DSM 15013) TaxID=318161 RepID=Q12KW0_SHEDO|nr:fumarylacetoacetate hydrolase family protein [Shewanella denitrificans]ABE55916.1 fumarylacetoacetate (FAA) hydrolase [Shewanella denitrificans OS217]